MPADSTIPCGLEAVDKPPTQIDSRPDDHRVNLAAPRRPDYPPQLATRSSSACLSAAGGQYLGSFRLRLPVEYLARADREARTISDF